jgi:hypothetical protein
MHSFDHVLNWTLKKGSHQFPGPDGGTCINEAAVVAASFPYRRVGAVDSMPECFSRPICRFAMMLNDQATDGERQRLLPFVTRLACADTPEVEKERADYINKSMGWTVSRDVAIAASISPAIGAVIVIGYTPLCFERGLATLEGALAIGRQADAFPAHEVEARLAAVRAKAAPREPIPTTPILPKVKNWIVIEETT